MEARFFQIWSQILFYDSLNFIKLLYKYFLQLLRLTKVVIHKYSKVTP